MLKKLRLPIVIFFILLASFYLASSVLAVDLFGNQQEDINQQLQLGQADPRIIVANIIRIALGFLGIIAVGLIIYAGFLWMTAAGDPAKTDKAKKILIGALIGIVIVLASFALATFILGKLLDSTGAPPPGPPPPPPPPPGGEISCDANPLTIACEPDAFSCGSGSYCDSASCTCRLSASSCDGNSISPTCEPDQTVCSGNEYCGDDCLCQPRGGLGDPCDGDTLTPSCQLDDNLCQSDLSCDLEAGCICSGAPIIDWISPVDGSATPNGAVGNFITIGGRYFGSSPGTVYFWNGSDYTVPAPFPASVNSSCSSDWQERQVIVIVPAGAVDGPIKLVTADSREDTTDNDRGSLINDFDVNSIVRPGLCLVNPDQGYLSDAFNLQGINFSGTARTVKFGNQTTNVTAGNISGWTANSVNAAVPNIRAGSSVFVSVDDNNSNILNFSVLFDSSSLPLIAYIDPPQGPVSQYITIYGSNFKSYLSGVSQVQFYLPADPDTKIPADISFPGPCQDSWWHDKNIVVKVPSLAAGAYLVTVTNRDNKVSQAADFPVIVGSPGPGLCLIEPHNGPVGQTVIAYGDNFGSSAGSPEFYNGQAGAISGWNNQRVNTSVPAGAQTGPFKIINNSGDVSNGLPFSVGACLTDGECYVTEECCPGDSYWSGICRLPGSCNAGAASQCAWGWTFSTTIAPPATCSGYSTAQACADAGPCPNSRGQCQSNSDYSAGQCGDAYCDSKFAACGGNCVYDNDANRCQLSGTSCDETLAVAGQTATCRQVGGLGVWQFNSGGASCPSGSFLDVNGWCSLGQPGSPQTCSLCPSGFNCQGGSCIINQTICPSGSTCQLDQCVLDNSVCQCCCRVGFAAQDCCAGLNCTPGGCGLDSPDYGLCTGCRVELDGNRGTVTAEEQAASDTACRCSGQDSRYCQIVNGDPLYDSGACADYGGLGDPCHDPDTAAACSSTLPLCGSGLFCDNLSCTCQPGGGAGDPCDSDTATPACDPDINMCSSGLFCDNLSCTCQPGGGAGDPCDSDTATPACDPDINMCSSGLFCDNLSCTCQPGGGAGEDCQEAAVAACTEGVESCSLPYECLTNSDSSDCRCCCTPGELNASGLECIEDQAPCDGATRGLFCGCSSDSQCDLVASDGCGNDTCCHNRPSVTSTEPADGAVDVCRNPLIKASFNEPMDIASFSGNLIVAGNYGTAPCPDGTTFLASLEVKTELSPLARLAYKFFSLAGKIIKPLAKLARAYPAPVSFNNYCAVSGSVSGYNDSSPAGLALFNPSRPLDANRLYYAIIKGDANLDSRQGVRNRYAVAMNGSNDETFNTVEFNNAKIWSFYTGEEVCSLDYVEIDPASYLFQTGRDDVDIGSLGAPACADDDDPANLCYDSLNDRDKIFYAYARSFKGQNIAPLAGFYDWNWGWSSDNEGVVRVELVNPLTADQVRVTAQNVKDGRTYVRARATITTDNVFEPSSQGRSKVGRSRVHVFICENPWPPRVNGTWQPWMDQEDNCDTGLAGSSCVDNNFEFYYCRDNNQTGTIDDLPAINNDAIIRGRDGNVLKEFYYLREELPLGANPAALTIVDQTNSPEARIYLSWGNVSGAVGYRLYYGTGSGNYGNFLDVANQTSYLLNGLDIGKTYYFSLTAYFSNGVETEFSAEASVTPRDTATPAVPVWHADPFLKTSAGNRHITLRWQANSDDTVSYKVYYGTKPGLYGGAKNVGDVTEADLTNLTNGTIYYFVITALDSYNNESAYSDEASNIPFAAPSGLSASPADSQVSLNWDGAIGAASYNVYYSDQTNDFSQVAPISVASGTAYTVSGLINGTVYYFAVTATNSYNNESEYSNQASVIPGP